MPSCALPSGVSRSAVARPSEIHLEEVVGGEVRRRSAVDKARQLALQIGVVFLTARRGGGGHITLLSNFAVSARSPPRGSRRSAKDRVSPGSRSGARGNPT